MKFNSQNGLIFQTHSNFSDIKDLSSKSISRHGVAVVRRSDPTLE